MRKQYINTRLEHHVYFSDRSKNVQTLAEMRYLVRYFRGYSKIPFENLKVEVRKHTTRYKRWVNSQTMRYDYIETLKEIRKFWYWSCQTLRFDNARLFRLMALNRYHKNTKLYWRIRRRWKFKPAIRSKRIRVAKTVCRNAKLAFRRWYITRFHIFMRAGTLGYVGNVYTSGGDNRQLLNCYKRIRMYTAWIGINFMSELKNIKKHQYNYLTNNRIECRGNSSSAVDFYKVENYAMRVDMKTHVFYAMADLMTISDMYRADIANSGYISNDVEYRPKREFLADKPSESFLDTIAVEYAPSNIPKIQFEPGWPTYFRSLRRDYYSINYLRFHYQWRLTHYLLRFRKITNSARLNYETFGLKMILVFAKYFTTIPQARDAILRGSFYVNGTNVTTPEFQLQPGDVVQMVFNYQHLNYVAGQFMYRSKILDEGIKAITGMRSHSNIKYYGSIRRSWKATRQFNHVRLSRMLKVYYTIYDVPRYIELDFITLSFVVIYNPQSLSDFDYLVVRRAAVSTIKMLNWKYIT